MQQLNIGQNATIQSNPSSLPELRAYCQSESISLDRLRSIFMKIFFLYYLGHPLDCTTYDYDILLVDICENEHVTYEIVQCAIEHVPGAASVVTTRGFTPLHFVCMNKNVTQDIVRCVLEGNPHAVLTQDERGCTPLFNLCSNRRVDETAAVESLALLLETCPESAQCCTHHGFLPIHYAVRRRSPDFCCMLIQKFPESIQHEVEGVPELYFVMFSSYVKDSVALAVLKMLLEDHPRMVRYVRWDGQSLLQYAASKHLPRAVEVCRLLIRAFPELVLELDESDSQPLHIACLYGNLPVVKCILELRPDAISGESSIGSYPIHVAVSKAAVEVVKFLLTFDLSVAAQEVNGSYPLIYACFETKASNLSSGLEVIKLLYNAYPEAIVSDEALFRLLIDNSRFVDAVRDFINEQLRYAAQASNLQLVRTQDGNGRLPLHHALEEDAPLGTIKLLVQADPATIQTPDSDGSLPSHIACEHHECPDVIKYLLDLYTRTRSLLVADNRGNTPLHCACVGGRYDVIEMLLTWYPNPAVCERNVDGDLPIQLLLDCDDQESADYSSCIFLLLKASPEMWMSNEDFVLALTS
ncbi:ankyrin repeat domain-containing protein [Skeletonema marinoi]|uniref:Ankyrin repeat domain-containing protein n=1 Tax=Skeletonema marinoi TaxID=267567 RepID=A0AAD8YBZ9_9STRA|nr:ankyrin repeat domain-containing protein [Skeletonema marinoi]